jgi:N-acetylglucosamine malate deacetylase 2
MHSSISAETFLTFIANRINIPELIPVLIIAGHPDDEVIGAGSILKKIQNIKIVHVTDGAPCNNYDAHKNGFKDKNEYSSARYNEMLSVLQLLSVNRENYSMIGLPDQGLIYNLQELVHIIYELLNRFEPAVVITHAYEGGHPDHDSIAFAVDFATKQLARNDKKYPLIFEMALYHGYYGVMESNSFIPSTEGKALRLILDEEDKQFKQILYSCYHSQKVIFQYFPAAHEEYRIAPQYNFTEPPHRGKLYYDNFDWGVKSSEWNSIIKEFTAGVKEWA